MKNKLFSSFDFSVLENPDFKEDSVREELILPILKKLGYQAYGVNKIIRSKALSHPFVKTGSKKRPITIIPDYLFQVNDKYTWVLDAKSPSEEIKRGEHIEQVYFYAIHPDIRVEYYALCNGKEFILYKLNQSEPLLLFNLAEIGNYWQELKGFLSPDIFSQKFIIAERDSQKEYKDSGFDYSKCKLPKPIIPQKQKAQRHFGVHGYFTKQAWNVVQEYIRNFTKPGDLVFDPFGGSGVTAIEAAMIDRKSLSLDINPLAVFIVNALIMPVDFQKLGDAFNRIKVSYEKKDPKSESEILSILSKYPYPKGIKLPKNSDVDHVDDLFSKDQLARLSLLKYLILKEKEENVKSTLMLMFSGLLNKVNLTYHASKGRSAGRGDSSVFRYYRYRIAKEPAQLDLWPYFESRFKKVVKAKKEIELKINSSTIHNINFVKGSATNLQNMEDESVDYIYTDPPYGSKIAYLDLSTMWNAWLDLEVTGDELKLEAIEGGEQKKSSDDYSNLLAQSILEMFRVLKYDRWMSFVFSHKDPKFWHLIVDTAEKAGFEYAGVVNQSNGAESFKKRQNPFSVLSGQLIINFKKIRSPLTIQKVQLGAEVLEIIIETIESVIASNEGATIEQINDELILKGLELGFLDILSKEYKDLNPILNEHFDYNNESKTFHIKATNKFRTSIPLDLRIRYFLLSYLRRKEKEKVYPTTDEIILDIMPLLKNGITPENQTILAVLEKVAHHIGGNRWKLGKGGQMSLFNL